MFKIALTILINILCIFAVNAKSFQSQKHSFQVETLFSELDHPWGMDFLPDGQLLITERSGQLHLANLDTKQIRKIAGLPKFKEHGQGGLLDVLVHPNFKSNQSIYLSYIKGEKRRYGTEVLRAKLNDLNVSDIETIFVAEPKVSGSRHFGSRLVIDADNYLFISLGDRGDRPLAQQLGSHIGSLIRLHDDGTVPSDNPFIKDNNALAEIFSYGHRNIQGMSLRHSDNSLWTHEHGPQGGDELNLTEKGNNYGWPSITYGANYGTGFKIGEGVEKEGMEQPVYYWVPSIAPSGMDFYEGDKFPNWKNSLFIGSLKFSTLVRLELDRNQVIHEERLLKNEFGRIRDVNQGPDGLIYLLTDSRNGKLLRINPLQ